MKTAIYALIGLACSGAVHAACNASITPMKPDSIYSDNHDGTVTDLETGLTWAKCSLGQTWIDNTADFADDDQCSGSATTYTWKSALEAAQSANGSSYLNNSDWRLPNVRELRSLVEKACVNSAINATVFPGTANARYWTSTPFSPNLNASEDAWHINFIDGARDGNAKTSTYRARLVRGTPWSRDSE